MICLIKNSEYQTMLAQSGIPEFEFDVFVGDYVERFGEYPKLDEIPHADSSPYLKDLIELDEYNGSKISKILQVTQTDNLEDATIALNDEFRDLEVSISPLQEEAIVEIRQRPSEYIEGETQDVNIDEHPNLGVVFSGIFDNLRESYGIDLISITDKELANNSSLSKVPEIYSAKAFIHNGKIYINTDKADIDAPIHEMTHMLLGAVRFKNPNLYFELIQQAENFPSLANIVRQNPNKTMSDILEETFVEEMSKYLAGLESAVSSLDERTLYKLHYDMKRLLDSSLMGQYSVKSVEDTELYNMSLRELAEAVQSSSLNTPSLSTLDDAALHRIMANTKSDLMKTGELEEYCS